MLRRRASGMIPMATSLCFGLIAATGLVLVLIPTFYYIYGVVCLRGGRANPAETTTERVKPGRKVDEPDEAVPV